MPWSMIGAMNILQNLKQDVLKEKPEDVLGYITKWVGAETPTSPTLSFTNGNGNERGARITSQIEDEWRDLEETVWSVFDSLKLKHKDQPVKQQVSLLKSSEEKNECKMAGLVGCMGMLITKQRQTIAELAKKVTTLEIAVQDRDRDRDTSPVYNSARKESNLSLSVLNRPIDLKFTKLLGMCNPLLDMSLAVSDNFLEKWGLEPDNAVLASDSTIDLFGEMSKDPKTSYIPGGSGLNTMRVAQWVLSAPGSTVFVGTTGEDDFGEILRGTTMNEGVDMLNITIPDEKTGTCAVLTTKDNKRSMVANLGASNVFDQSWLNNNPSLKNAMDVSTLYYITGFFLRTTPETVFEVMQTGNKKNKPVCLNLSAPFVIQAVGKAFAEAFTMSNIVFGNDAEYLALDDAMDWDLKDIEKIAKKIQALPGVRSRIVVVTQGGDDVIVANKYGIANYPTPPIQASDIVDTNGAGDGFVGGFLAKYSKGGTVEECVKIGQWAASIIIKRPGCSIPPLPPGCCVSMGTPQPDRRPALSHSAATKTVTKRQARAANGKRETSLAKKEPRRAGRTPRHTDPSR